MSRVVEVLCDRARFVSWIEATSSVSDAIKMMLESDIEALLVKDGGHISGIVTERNYLRCGALRGRSDRETHVCEIMSSPVVCVSSDTDVEECMALMTECRIRYAAVVEGGEFVGMISIGDVVEFQSRQQSFQLRKLKDQLKLLEDYITSR